MTSVAHANLQLRKFDPFQMPPDIVRTLAVGREALLRDLIGVVEENLESAGTPPQHLCLIAPRGTGKTFLLRLLGLQLEDRAAAGDKLRFLHLPEEMPHVLSPIAFLREIRRRLRGEAPAANAPRKRDDPAEWNGLVADIDRCLADRFGAGAGLLVLCVENIKDVLRDAFPETAQQRTLRAWLERPAGRIMLIAASSSGPFDKDADKAIFAIGRDIELKPWTTDQTMQFLDRVVQARDGHSLRVEDERVARAITTFTGGSPRMAVALAEVLGAEDALSAARTLDSLIDNLQQYYLDRLRDMGKDAARCIANLLTEGENVSQTEVARRLGMTQSEIAQIFAKLVRDVVVVGQRLAGHKEYSYRVADRVFVHFYHVRVLSHGSERSVLAPILDFLVSAFSETQRVDQAERLMARGLHRDARILFETLPVADEVVTEYYWWHGIRGNVAFAADFIAERAADAVRLVDALRLIVADRSKALSTALQLAHAEPHDQASGLAELTIGLACLATGQLGETRYWLAKIPSPAAPSWLACLACIATACIEYLSGNPDGHIDWAKKAEHIARQTSDNVLLEASLVHVAYNAAVRGNLAVAEQIAREISELAYPPGWGWMATAGLRRLSSSAERRSEHEAATRIARQALDIAEAFGNAESIAHSQLRLAAALLAEAKPAVALELADQAGKISRTTGELKDYLDAVDVAGDALRALGQSEAAIQRRRETISLLEPSGGPYLRAASCADLAWELSSPAIKPNDVPSDEVRHFADAALAIIDDRAALAHHASLALEAKLAVARDGAERQAIARQLIPFARKSERREELAWAWAELLTALFNTRQFGECVDAAVTALAEVLPMSEDVSHNASVIAMTLVRSLRDSNKLTELKSIAARVLDATAGNANRTRRAAMAGVFLPAAVNVGEYEWGVDLAEDLLHGDPPPAPAVRMDLALAAIAGGMAWDRMAGYLSDRFWETAAAQVAGADIAGVLTRTEQAEGRPAAYRVFNGFWIHVRDERSNRTLRTEIVRQLLTNHQLSTLSAGLLADIADTITAEADDRFAAEARMLREFARFNAAGRDPATLARLDPDIGTALLLADPTLQPPPLAPPPAGRRRRATTRASKTRGRK